jgi:hypothetical protein
MMRHLRFILSAVVTTQIALITLARAEPQELVVRLTVRPSATTQSSLQFKLLPELVDQTPGNAATLYLMASKLGPDRKLGYELENRADDLLKPPAESMHAEQARDVLGPFAGRLRLADLAAHRQEAHWDYSLREEGLNALLPHLNDVRGFASLWSLEARLQILDNDWPAAARRIADGLSLARQLNRQAVMVQALVGTGIADETLTTGVSDWIARAGSPNLYWSLSELPQPFVDVHEIAGFEKAIVYYTFPVLRDSSGGKCKAESWREFIAQLPGLARQLSVQTESNVSVKFQASVLAAAAYPQARADLLASGRSASEVDAMDVDQAVGIYFVEHYRRLRERAWAAWELPFWEGHADLADRTAEINAERSKLGGNPLAYFFPQLAQARYQFCLVDREIALLRTVEAIRDYAAHHDGNPPASLEEIKNLPIPIDPVRNLPFRYERHGQTATIEALPYDGQVAHGERYELTIAT